MGRQRSFLDVLLLSLCASALPRPSLAQPPGGPRPGCLRNAYECNLLKGQCGVYIFCDNKATAVNCQQCSPDPAPDKPPAQYCNYNWGRCNGTWANGAGTPCGTGSGVTCSGSGYYCLKDKRYKSKTGFRCCRVHCPDGAWGGRLGFYWRNECGTRIKCHPKA